MSLLNLKKFFGGDVVILLEAVGIFLMVAFMAAFHPFILGIICIAVFVYLCYIIYMSGVAFLFIVLDKFIASIVVALEGIYSGIIGLMLEFGGLFS